MCTILGWSTSIPEAAARHMLAQGSRRGRDGWGFIADGKEFRGVGAIPESIVAYIANASRVVGNFRATPTTEAETRVELLQPYQGIVHNGTIANDRDFGEFAIDSQCLPVALARADDAMGLYHAVKKLKGSYALAYFRGEKLLLAVNYKPIHYTAIRGGIMFASQPYMLPGQSHALKPYSVSEVSSAGMVSYLMPREQPKRALVACSAGLDSTTVAYMLKAKGYEVALVHFVYGCQAEGREVERVRAIAAHGGFEVVFLELPRPALAGTIVEGRFSKEREGITGAEYAIDWVSARNLLMLAVMTAYAESKGFGYIAFGGNLEESGAYPDNEEEFARRFNDVLPFATQNGVAVELLHPLTHLMKHEIVAEGLLLGVPYELTWSCYGGGEKHCGECGPCFMRAKAFERNLKIDPVMQ